MSKFKVEDMQKKMKEDRCENDKFLKPILKYLHSYFKEICTLISCGAVFLTHYVKEIFYAYQSGILKIYNIDTSYIDVNEISFFSFVDRLAIVLITIVSNVIIVEISRCSLKFWKKFLKILGILIFETLGISLLSIYEYCTGILEVLKVIATSHVSTLLLLSFIFALTINIASFVEILFYWKEGKPKDKIINLQGIKTCIVVSLIAATLLIPAVQSGSEYIEKTRSAYKVVMIDFNDKKQEPCAVVYENKDVYIVCPIRQNENENGICKNKTIAIDKKGVLTYYCDDIHDKEILKESLK